MREFETLAELAALVGQDIGVSDWILLDQARIQKFADASDDQQWIHTDPERAAAGPFGATIAHGFLTLSLLPLFLESAFRVKTVRMGLNYGLGRVRFPAPVPVGSRLRGHFKLKRLEAIAGGVQSSVEVAVEREGLDKPVCIAEWLIRQFE